jgi:ABC-type phosphonate transport system ATPase subunit
MTHLLEISNVSKIYKNGKGIKNISFNIGIC